jgi:hypothetical protein
MHKKEPVTQKTRLPVYLLQTLNSASPNTKFRPFYTLKRHKVSLFRVPATVVHQIAMADGTIEV